jgi:AcrR family transcriptional regulator
MMVLRGETMNGFERRKQLKMQQIREAALDLFSHFGVQKVSIQDIAQRANVSPVTIYNYFGSKEDLLLDVLSNYFETRLQQFLKIINSDLSFQEKIGKMVEAKVEETKKLSPSFIQSIFMTTGPVRELIQTFAAEKSIPHLMELLEEGKKEGYISNDLSPELLLFYIQLLFDGISKQSHLFSSEDQRDKHTKQLIHLFFYGLMGQKKEDEPPN